MFVRFSKWAPRRLALKRLSILRHAKSDWGQSGLDDFDRPLNARGREAAGLIRRAIEQRRPGFDFIVSSPSARTRETLGLIGLDAAARWDDEIYLAGVDTLMGVVRALPDEAQSALIVGHNPGMHELVLKLGRPDSDGLRQRLLGKFPTGAFAVLELEIESWADAAPGCGEIAELLLPRELG